MNGNDNEFRAAYAQAQPQNEVDRVLTQMRESVDACISSLYEKVEDGTGEQRGTYLLIDGKPATVYIERYLQESKADRNPENLKKLLDDLVISACLQGRRVDCVLLGPDDFSVKAGNIESFPLVYVQGDHIPENIRAEIAARMNPGTIPLDPPPENVEEAVNQTVDVLARRRQLMVEKFTNSSSVYMMKDFFRDMLSDPSLNPDGTRTMKEIADDVKSTVGMEVERTALLSHAVGMMLLEGNSVEEIFDPANSDLRAKAGRRFFDMCKNGEREAIVRLNVRIAQKINTLLDDELDKIDFSSPEVNQNVTFNRLAALAGMNFDMKQERARNKTNEELALKVLAAQNGRDLSEPGAREESEKVLDSLNDRSVKLGYLRMMPMGYKDALDGLIGLRTPGQLDKSNMNKVLASELWRKDIAAAQKNGKPVSSVFTDKYIGNSINIPGAAEDPENSDLLGDRLDELCDYDTPEELRDFCSNILDGTFARENVFAVIEKGNKPYVILQEREAGVMTKYDHADHDPDFWGGEFVKPTEKEYETNNEGVKAEIHRRLFTDLQNHFGITVRSGMDRMYMLDGNGSLVSLAEQDFTSPEGKKLARDLATSGRLFAVRPDETAPVQVNVRQVENPGHKDPKFETTVSDGLDSTRKVTYRFYHALGAMLGIQSCVERKAAHEKEQACARFRASMNRIKEERAEKITYDVLHEQNERAKTEEKEKELASIDKTARGRELAFKAIGEYYGPHPKFHPEYVPLHSYTEEEFNSLKNYDFGFVNDPPIGTPPAMKDGKIELREADFAALAIAAASRHQVTGDFRRGNGEDHPDESGIIVTDSNSTMYLDDLAQHINDDGTGMTPRAGIGKYIPKAIAPARDIAAEAVKEYQQGNKQPMARLIADGLSAANRTQLRCQGITPGDAAVQKYYGAFGDMMKADPALGALVREEGKNIVREATALRAQNEQAYQNFKAQHGPHIQNVVDTLTEQNKAIKAIYDKIDNNRTALSIARAKKGNEMVEQLEKEKKELETQVQQLHAEQQEYFNSEENRNYYSLVVQGANYVGIDKHYEMDSRLDVDQTVRIMEEKRRVTEAFEAGTQAKATLERAKLNGEELSPEKKTELMKAVFKSELIRHSNAAEQASIDIAVNMQTENSPEIRRLVDKNARPARRDYDSKLSELDKKESDTYSSFANKVRQLHHCANQTDPISQLSQKLIHPDTEDREFEEVFPKLYAKADKLKDMSADTLLADAKGSKVERAVTEYLKTLAAGNQPRNQIADPSLAVTQTNPNANNADLNKNDPANNRSVV